MEVKSTRLRFISARNPGELVSLVSQLPFKVEIKGGPIFQDGTWVLFFVIPDHIDEFINIEI